MWSVSCLLPLAKSAFRKQHRQRAIIAQMECEVTYPEAHSHHFFDPFFSDDSDFNGFRNWAGMINHRSLLSRKSDETPF